MMQTIRHGPHAFFGRNNGSLETCIPQPVPWQPRRRVILTPLPRRGTSHGTGYTITAPDSTGTTTIYIRSDNQADIAQIQAYEQEIILDLSKKSGAVSTKTSSPVKPKVHSQTLSSNRLTTPPNTILPAVTSSNVLSPPEHAVYSKTLPTNTPIRSQNTLPLVQSLTKTLPTNTPIRSQNTLPLVQPVISTSVISPAEPAVPSNMLTSTLPVKFPNALSPVKPNALSPIKPNDSTSTVSPVEPSTHTEASSSIKPRVPLHAISPAQPSTAHWYIAPAQPSTVHWYMSPAEDGVTPASFSSVGYNQIVGQPRSETPRERLPVLDTSARRSAVSYNDTRALRYSVSYNQMIGEALLNAPEGQLPVYDILAYIANKYSHRLVPSWKANVRANLRTLCCFQKNKNHENDSCYTWSIRPSYLDDFRKGIFVKKTTDTQRSLKKRKLEGKRREEQHVSHPSKFTLNCNERTSLAHLPTTVRPMETDTSQYLRESRNTWNNTNTNYFYTTQLLEAHKTPAQDIGSSASVNGAKVMDRNEISVADTDTASVCNSSNEANYSNCQTSNGRGSVNYRSESHCTPQIKTSNNIRSDTKRKLFRDVEPDDDSEFVVVDVVDTRHTRTSPYNITSASKVTKRKDNKQTTQERTSDTSLNHSGKPSTTAWPYFYTTPNSSVQSKAKTTQSQQVTYTAPTSQQVTYTAPTSQQVTYTAPTSQQVTYTAPTSQHVTYTAPTSQQVTYTAPTSQSQQVTYTAPTSQSQQVTYTAPTSQSQQVTYTAPTLRAPLSDLKPVNRSQDNVMAPLNRNDGLTARSSGPTSSKEEIIKEELSQTCPPYKEIKEGLSQMYPPYIWPTLAAPLHHYAYTRLSPWESMLKYSTNR